MAQPGGSAARGDAARERDGGRAAPPPIPSTLRSPKVPLQPWNGRRVGDQINRAHARKRTNPPPPVLDDQFIQNFFTWALARAPNGDEPVFWNDQFRVAYAQGQTSLKLAAVALGKTLFESAEYAARGRDAHGYVYDLYKTYLMREPDTSGWATGKARCRSTAARTCAARLKSASEFAAILASIVPNGAATSKCGLVDLGARGSAQSTRQWDAGARCELECAAVESAGTQRTRSRSRFSYSSMVWTRSGPYIHFDEDNGFPSPGFRLGFPTVQRRSSTRRPPRMRIC